jgi:excisionase family DNA binding protein
MEMKNHEGALPVQEAANYLGLAVSTLNKLRCSGGGPAFFKLGRAVRYDLEDLKEWLASRRFRSTSEITHFHPD